MLCVCTPLLVKRCSHKVVNIPKQTGAPQPARCQSNLFIPPYTVPVWVDYIGPRKLVFSLNHSTPTTQDMVARRAGLARSPCSVKLFGVLRGHADFESYRILALDRFLYTILWRSFPIASHSISNHLCQSRLHKHQLLSSRVNYSLHTFM